MTLFDKVQDTIAVTLGLPVNEITAGSTAEDVALWDSLGQVRLTIAIEETFGVVIDAEDFPSLTSVRKIMEFLSAHGIS